MTGHIQINMTAVFVDKNPVWGPRPDAWGITPDWNCLAIVLQSESSTKKQPIPSNMCIRFRVYVFGVHPFWFRFPHSMIGFWPGTPGQESLARSPWPGIPGLESPAKNLWPGIPGQDPRKSPLSFSVRAANRRRAFWGNDKSYWWNSLTESYKISKRKSKIPPLRGL